MFFSGLIKSKILSLLRPYLSEPPGVDLHLRLGPITSVATFRNLHLDPSAINPLLLGAPYDLAFKSVVVEEVNLVFSSWASLAIDVTVRGVRVVLSAGELEERSARTAGVMDDLISEDLRKRLSAIDPEGYVLHEALKKLLSSLNFRENSKSAFINLIYKNCQLHILDFCLDLEFPVLGDCASWFSGFEELHVVSQHHKQGCILRGLAGLMLVRSRDCSFAVKCRGFNIGYSKNNQTNRNLSCKEFKISTVLKDLSLSKLDFRTPEFSLSCSPADVAFLSNSNRVLSQKGNRGRRGRQLWKLAARRIREIYLLPRYSLHKLFRLLILWLRYVNAYKCLLLLVGYPNRSSLRRSYQEISRSRTFKMDSQNYWKKIISLGKGLPPNAIAQAWMVARHRASIEEPVHWSYPDLHLYQKILAAITKCIKYIWYAICNVLYYTWQVCLWKPSSQELKYKFWSDVPVDGLCQKRTFTFQIGKAVLSFRKINEVCSSVPTSVESHTGISYANFISFQVLIGAASVKCIEEIFEQSSMICCGKLTVSTAPTEKAAPEASAPGQIQNDKNANRKLQIKSETIIRCDPVDLLAHSEYCEVEDSSSNLRCDESYIMTPMMVFFEGWQNEYGTLGDTDVGPSENPFFLCKVSNHLSSPNPKISASGLWKCNLLVGKIHVTFERFSMLLLALFLGQTGTALEHALPDISARSLDVLDIPWSRKYQTFTDKISSTLRSFPEKHIQLTAFIAGPQIRISLDKGEMVSESDDWSFFPHHLAFDFRDLEIMMSHECEFNKEMQSELEDHGHSGQCALMTESPKFYSRSVTDTRYMAHVFLSHNLYIKANGLTVSLDDSVGNQKMKSFVLAPSKCLLSYKREGLYEFGSMSDALAVSFCWSTNLIGLFYMDEISLVTQLISDLSSVLSCSTCDSCVGCFPTVKRTEMMKRDQMHFEGYENAFDGSIHAGKELQYLLRGSLHVSSIDISLHKSRGFRVLKLEGFDTETTNEENFNNGIWISAEPFCLDMCSNYEKTEVCVDLSGIRSVIFVTDANMDGFFDNPQSRMLILKSLDCLAEAYLSNSIVACELHCQKFTAESESSFSSWPMQKLKFPSSMVLSVLDRWILINISLGEIFVRKPSEKETLLGAHKIDKFFSSLSIGGEFQIISWKMQGGILMIEMRALNAFLDYYALFLHHEEYIFKLASEDVEKTGVEVSASHGSLQNGIFPEVLNFDMSQFSLIIAVADQSGRIRELIVEVNITLNYERALTNEKLLGNFSPLSILSQVIHRESANETYIHCVPSDMMSQEISGYSDAVPTVKKQVGLVKGVVPLQDTASPSTSQSSISEFINISHKKFILEHFIASVQVEKLNFHDEDPNCAWLGQCSLSGVDLTLSLSDIEFIIDMLESRNGLPRGEVMNKPGLQNPHLTTNQELEKTFEAIIPDGAVVAIQDVDEHMYFTAKGRRGKYRSVGSFHYSLVGKQALYRVKYNSRRVSRSSAVWFSLISLHAKDLSGQPLALAYRRGSSFVEFSGNCSSSLALWRAVSCKTHGSEGFVFWKEYDQLFNGTFYLENKKNGCAVAIINGVPEFVHNPGNAFKFKVFKPADVLYDPSPSISSSPSQLRNEDIEMRRRPFPCIDVKVEDISVTLVHDILHVEHVFTLIKGQVVDIQLIVHGLPAKVRIIATCRALLDCYETQKNKWRELLQPVEIKIYYRTRLPIHGHDAKHGAPVYLFCKIEELHFSLTEKSIDALLFIVGKLNISGPYEIKEGAVLSNCYKVQNRTGASLLCKFHNQQSMKIAGNHATLVYPRYLASESIPSVSLQLAFLGSYSTSPIDVSLLEGCSVAWRTRIVSFQDSRTYPGPFLLVDIDRYSEDGISIVASPLVKIHNETDFSLELRFQRPQLEKDEFASVLLKSGGTMDDTTAMFDSINFSGGVKKAITSLSVGNFLFSFRPKFHEAIPDSRSSFMADWSGHINGGKAVRLSGIFSKLSYRVRRAFQGKSMKVSTSTASCAVKSSDTLVENLHFFIQSYERGVPIVPNNNVNEGNGGDAPIVLLEQKAIFVLPTVQVCNLLLTEIHVLLIDDPDRDAGCHSMGNEATILSGSTINFYADPAKLYFVVTLTAFSSRCKTINSADWLKNFRGKEIGYLDIDLDFADGKYFATLRLSRSHTGILQAYIFTPHALKNESDLPLLIHLPHQRNLPGEDARKMGLSVTPDIGLVLFPKSSGSWFLKLTKVQVTLLENDSLKTILDLGSLSGLSEIRLEMMGAPELKPVIKFGVHVEPAFGNLDVPARCITLVPRHVIVNNSERNVIARQFFLEDDTAGITKVLSGQRAMLQLRSVINEKRRYNLVENLIRKHQNMKDDMLFVQLRVDNPRYGWSGPICVASLGSFFIKFKRQEDHFAETGNTKLEFAHVHIVEEGSSLVLQFYSPPNVKLPYKIENHLPDFLLTYYQKDTSYTEILPPNSSTHYVWDDLTIPRKLVVQINDLDLIREINLDKLREWKPFFKERRYRGISSQLFSDRKLGNDKNKFIAREDMTKLGYEVYADGPTRVLRICEIFNSCRRCLPLHSSEKIRLRIPRFVGNLLETKMTEGSETEKTVYTPLVSANIANICFDAIFSDQQRYIQITVEALNVDPKWTGAPFAAIIRKHYSSNNYSNHCMLKVVAVMESSFSSVRHVRHMSIVLQPVDVNLDEETLMRIVPFWRSSLSESNTQSQQYYFDHFEIHPIKITANFLPGDGYSSYSSAQETLRSLIHSVVKIPQIKNMVVELNGVLITHALITLRELSIRCAQHYSWYAMRAIYLAKGSPLLPPGFTSMFDDLASSSLDVFFDPSQGLLKLPGFTSNAFKLIRKSLGKQGHMGTRRYLGDLGKTLKSAGSNVLFAAATEISDSVLRGAESNGLDGMINGFHQGILKLAMEPSVLGSALLEGGPERTIMLDQSPGVDELYIEGYLQAMLDSIYKQEYLRVRVVDNQVFLKNLPPNNALIEEIMDRVRGFLVSRALLKGDPSTSRPLRHLRGESEWKIGPTLITLCEHLFVSFAISALRNQATKLLSKVKQTEPEQGDTDRPKSVADQIPAESASAPELNDKKGKAIVPANNKEQQKAGIVWRWGIGKFLISGVLAYIDGRLCRCIPNPIIRRIVSGFVLSFLDRNDKK